MENIVKLSELDYSPFPIPGATADKLSVKLLNLDTKYGPVFAELKLEPGAYIPAHIHHRTAEQHFVLEGDFIDNGVSYGPGTFFCHNPGQKHGPHASKTGCRVLFIQPVEVDPTDFEIVE